MSHDFNVRAIGLPKYVPVDYPVSQNSSHYARPFDQRGCTLLLLLQVGLKNINNNLN